MRADGVWLEGGGSVSAPLTKKAGVAEIPRDAPRRHSARVARSTLWVAIFPR